MGLVFFIVKQASRDHESIALENMVLLSISAFSVFAFLFSWIRKRDSLIQRIALGIIRITNRFSFSDSEKNIAAQIKDITKETMTPIVFGEPFVGKTTSAFLNASEILTDATSIGANKPQVIYIDCKSDVEKIVEFIYAEFHSSTNTKVKHIIIDNAEILGDHYISTILKNIQNYSGQLVIIFDSKEILDNLQFSKTIPCSNPAPNHLAFDDEYCKLSSDAKNMLWLIYYYSLTSTLIDKQIIAAIWTSLDMDAKPRKLLSELKKGALIVPFFLQKTYYYHACLKDMNDIEERSEDAQVVRQKIFQDKGHDIHPLMKWVVMVSEKPLCIETISQEERYELFEKCFSITSPEFMYHFLLRKTSFDTKKQALFLYEIGSLEFNRGNHEIAFSYFDNLIKHVSDDSVRYLLMLKIIESVHGQNDTTTKNKICAYIKELKSTVGFVDLATYWELHIDTERGLFRIEAFEDLLKRIKDNNDIPKGIKNSIIKRCYTDIIRVYCIQMTCPPDSLIEDFLSFLSEHCSKTTLEYYEQLYTKASIDHCVRYLENIFEQTNNQHLFQQCRTSYLKALQSGTENIKSLSACKLKAIDFSLNNASISQSEYSDAKKTIELFIHNSIINKVDVHEAYGKTLLYKLDAVFMLSNFENESNTPDSILLDEAKAIYSLYGNKYGQVRTSFLFNLVRLTKTNDREILVDIIADIEEMLEEHPDYVLENNILNDIKGKNCTDNLSLAYRYAILKAYPIILQ